MISFKKFSLVAAVAFVMAIGMAVTAVAESFCDFDDNVLIPNSHWGGAGSGETYFVSGDWCFLHDDATYSWGGSVYSNESDTTTAGCTNQFSAITGAGLGGSGNYGVCCVPMDYSNGYVLIPQTISSGASTENAYNAPVENFYVTNTTYAYLAMLNGDSYSKKFGGATGDDEDWFLLTIKGISESGDYTGTVEFYLADFRFGDNSQDYIINEWTEVDLSCLGDVVGLEFNLSSSDSGSYGMNTPAYFAFDGASVPEPCALALFGSLTAAGLLFYRRKA